MLTHNLTPETLLERAAELPFPESVVGLFAGEIGYPEGGFPKALREAILKGRKPVEGRMGALLPPVDFAKMRAEVERKIQQPASEEEVLSYLMYPKVFTDFMAHRHQYADVSPVPTEVFFYGMEPNDEVAVTIEEGKTLYVKYVARTAPDEAGQITLLYELNGQPREVQVPDRSLTATVRRPPKADPDNMHHVGAPMPGAAVEVAVKAGQRVEKDDLLVILEAMKVQVYINSPIGAIVKEALVKNGDTVATNDLLVVFE
jgi:pyruvate carboxylase